MDFLTLLALYATSHGISEDEMLLKHQNYCQNLYFQPNSIERMQEASCDIDAVWNEIARVKSGKY